MYSLDWLIINRDVLSHYTSHGLREVIDQAPEGTSLSVLNLLERLYDRAIAGEQVDHLYRVAQVEKQMRDFKN
jgi:hypothetical protein